MKLKGAEKHFWWHFRQITDSRNIPAELPGFTSIDSLVDDEFLGKELQRLTLMKHENITKDCLPYLNKLTDLKYLDIWRTKIRLEDLGALTNLKKLRELYISAGDEEEEPDRDAILEKIIKAEETLPNCAIRTSYQ